MKKKTTAPAAAPAVSAPAEGAIQFCLPAITSRTKRYKEVMYMSKEKSLKLLNPLREIIKKTPVDGAPGTSSKSLLKFREYLEIDKPDKIHKDDLTETYAAFSSVTENIYSLALMDAKLLECWKQIIISPQILSDTIKKICGRDINAYYRSSWDENEIYVDCAFFPLTCLQIWNYYGWLYRDEPAAFRFTLGPDVRRKLCDLFYGESFAAPILVEELPENEKFTVCNFEKSISSDLMYFDGLSLTGSPLTPSTGVVAATKLKAIKKSLNSPEFPQFGRPYPLDRIELLTLAYFTLKAYWNTGNTAITPELFSKDVQDEFPQWLLGKMFEAFLPAFKGFAKQWTDGNNAEEYAKAVKLLLEPASEKWMSLSNLEIRFLCQDVHKNHKNIYVRLFTFHGRSKNSLRPKDDNSSSKVFEDDDANWFNEIEFPFILHWIEFLCAVGIVEIAYAKDPQTANDDPLEGMRYVRLTPLGRYAFGIDKEYHAPEVAETYQLEYDDANAIITVLSPNCPYTVFLAQVCRPIGTSRFRISPETLIHGCDNKAQVEERIKKLCLIIPVDKHPWLQNIVEETKKRITAITPEKTRYKILKIGADNPGLIRALTANKEIRENCRFAEGSLIMVPTAFLDRFRDIALTLGYLPDL